MSNLPVKVEIDLDKAAVMTRDELREMIARLEDKLKDAPQMEMPVRHHFSHGVYAREMEMTADSLVIGKIHRHRTMNFITKGSMTVISQDGIKHLKVGDFFVSTPGAKRVIVAHEDSAWTCVHGTHETDIEKIEEEFIAKDYSEVVEKLECKEALCLGSQSA
jgi:quercetin dioxygenase-like cupin family protein